MRFTTASLASIVLLCTAVTARAQESMASFPDGGLPIGKIHGPDVPPVAHRLFGELECTCGRCRRMRLSKCPCGFASKEREEIMGMLRGKDLSTPEPEDAAYREILQAFVGRHGKKPPASDRGGPQVDPFMMGFVIVVVAAGLGLFGYVIFTSKKSRRSPQAAQARLRPRKKPKH